MTPTYPKQHNHSRWRKSRKTNQFNNLQNKCGTKDCHCWRCHFFFLQFKVLWKYLRDLCHCRHTPNFPGPWKQLSLVKGWGDMLENGAQERKQHMTHKSTQKATKTRDAQTETTPRSMKQSKNKTAQRAHLELSCFKLLCFRKLRSVQSKKVKSKWQIDPYHNITKKQYVYI